MRVNRFDLECWSAPHYRRTTLTPPSKINSRPSLDRYVITAVMAAVQLTRSHGRTWRSYGHNCAAFSQIISSSYINAGGEGVYASMSATCSNIMKLMMQFNRTLIGRQKPAPFSFYQTWFEYVQICGEMRKCIPCDAQCE